VPGVQGAGLLGAQMLLKIVLATLFFCCIISCGKKPYLHKKPPKTEVIYTGKSPDPCSKEESGDETSFYEPVDTREDLDVPRDL
jgi:hypothetical protein